MSNGFLTVSWTNPGGTVDRVVWDPNNIVGGVFTGLIANPAGATLLTEDVSAVAGLPLGRIALLGRDTSALDVTGLLEDLVRTTTGDGTSENLTGDSLRDVMFGLGGNDTLNGNEANDILEGGAGADVLNGGPGSDTASYAGSPAEVTVNLVTGIGTGGDAAGDTFTSIENLIGSAFDDTFTPDANANNISGGGGNDTVSYAGSPAAVNISLSGTPGTGGNAAGDVLGGVENLIGSDFGDFLRGNLVLGGGGNDSVVGGTGNDRFNGEGGDDFLFGSDFNPDGSFVANSGADTLEGGDGHDGLWGADGNDHLLGGVGSDGLVGGAGNDSLDGSDGADFLFGGDFSVVDGSFVPNSGDDTLNGGNGNDGLWGFDGNDVINADAGNDYVEGGEGNDVILGGADNDTLLGQGGADTIGGGTSFDYLYGGFGADTFILQEGRRRRLGP